MTDTPPDRVLSSFLTMKGPYRCNKSRCKICSHIQHGLKNFEGPYGKPHTINSLISCSTAFVVYGLSCPCGKRQVGRTIRPLREWFEEHRNNVKKRFPKHSVSRHLQPNTMAIFNCSLCLALRPFHPISHRGSDIKNCSKETHWISKLDTLDHKGLNLDLDLQTLTQRVQDQRVGTRDQTWESHHPCNVSDVSVTIPSCPVQILSSLSFLTMLQILGG